MARSFSATCGPDGLTHHLADLRSAVPAAAGGVLFVTGQLTQRVSAIAELVRASWRGVPCCVVPAAGVLSERGEIEGESAASGVLWSGGQVTPFALPEDAEEPSRVLRETLGRIVGSRPATAILFARPDAFSPEMIDALALGAPNACIFGAGTAFSSAVAVTAQGELVEGLTTGLAITGFAPPIVDASPACRLISSFHPIEEASGGMVLRIHGRPALEALAAATAELTAGDAAERGARAQPLVFAAIADAEDEPSHAAAGEQTAPRFFVRPIRGIDQSRRGLMIGDDARAGARIAFAVRDAPAARAGLDSIARQVSRSALGSAPRFALYLSCAGRGQGLYGVPDVEARILRQRFADLPIAGMHSAFEIVPWGPGRVKLALHTGVLALFRAPS